MSFKKQKNKIMRLFYLFKDIDKRGSDLLRRYIDLEINDIKKLEGSVLYNCFPEVQGCVNIQGEKNTVENLILDYRLHEFEKDKEIEVPRYIESIELNDIICKRELKLFGELDQLRSLFLEEVQAEKVIFSFVVSDPDQLINLDIDGSDYALNKEFRNQNIYFEKADNVRNIEIDHFYGSVKVFLKRDESIDKIKVTRSAIGSFRDLPMTKSVAFEKVLFLGKDLDLDVDPWRYEHKYHMSTVLAPFLENTVSNQRKINEINRLVFGEGVIIAFIDNVVIDHPDMNVFGRFSTFIGFLEEFDHLLEELRYKYITVSGWVVKYGYTFSSITFGLINKIKNSYLKLPTREGPSEEYAVPIIQGCYIADDLTLRHIVKNYKESLSSLTFKEIGKLDVRKIGYYDLTHELKRRSSKRDETIAFHILDKAIVNWDTFLEIEELGYEKLANSCILLEGECEGLDLSDRMLNELFSLYVDTKPYFKNCDFSESIIREAHVSSKTSVGVTAPSPKNYRLVLASGRTPFGTGCNFNDVQFRDCNFEMLLPEDLEVFLMCLSQSDNVSFERCRFFETSLISESMLKSAGATLDDCNFYVDSDDFNKVIEIFEENGELMLEEHMVKTKMDWSLSEEEKEASIRSFEDRLIKNLEKAYILKDLV